MSKIASRIVLLYIMFILTGCAPIARGLTQNIPISSFPAGAQVTINNQFWGYSCHG